MGSSSCRDQDGLGTTLLEQLLWVGEELHMGRQVLSGPNVRSRFGVASGHHMDLGSVAAENTGTNGTDST